MFGFTPAELTTDFWILIKGFAVVGLLIYNVFAFVIVRQVTQMTKTLTVGFEGPIILFSWVHMIAALALLVLSIVVL